MAHTFLVEAGRWNLEGNWLERDRPPIVVKGRMIVAWGQDDWYSMVTKLIFPGGERDEITFQYRGRFDDDARRYTFVLQHSELGHVEGEGWITPGAIVQRYWALNDKQRRSGFETLHRISDGKYCLSSGILAGHQLMSAMDAILDLQYR
ncbi:MAG TPA: hypothetical protein IGS17_17075 [Oscillatoriales cyanobacterium M59_W2019_021]|nr:MAG: hypothetical protein D6728_16670 [Cyanobacteria bacterium J055]HIK33146.1 hypothetical protein [Oscillatoriales cyanobacterium M4454_W2019_049]HIK52619.1 hypothetical protein [Oscillatoriales cyanobacterium M59_W2019_021]